MEIELILKNETRIMYKVSYKPKINSFPYKIVDVCKYLEEEVIQKNMSYGNEIYAQEWGYQNIRSIQRDVKMSLIDYKLMNFIAMENEFWNDIMDDNRDGYTLEFQEKTRMYIRKIILNIECGNLHSEDD